MIKKLLFCLVIVSIFKRNESISTKEQETNSTENKKEDAKGPLSNEKQIKDDIVSVEKNRNFENKEGDRVTLNKVKTYSTRNIAHSIEEEIKPTESNQKDDDKTVELHTLTKQKDEGDLNADDKAKTATKISKKHRRNSARSKEIENVQEMRVDHGTTSRPFIIDRMDGAFYNKTAQLIRMVQNADVHSRDDTSPNTVRNSPEDKSKEERRYMISNIDVLESYIKGRRSKIDPTSSLKDLSDVNPNSGSSQWSGQDEVLQGKEDDAVPKPRAFAAINYKDWSDDYIIETTKRNIWDYDHESWVATENVNWDDVETSGEREEEANETISLEKEVAEEEYEIGLRPKGSGLMTKKDNEVKSSQESKTHHELRNREEGKSVQKPNNHTKVKKIKSNSEQLQISNLQHVPKSIKTNPAKRQRQKYNKKQENVRTILKAPGKSENRMERKHPPRKDKQEKRKKQQESHEKSEIISKQERSYKLDENNIKHNAVHFKKGTKQNMAKNENVSGKKDLSMNKNEKERSTLWDKHANERERVGEKNDTRRRKKLKIRTDAIDDDNPDMEKERKKSIEKYSEEQTNKEKEKESANNDPVDMDYKQEEEETTSSRIDIEDASNGDASTRNYNNKNIDFGDNDNDKKNDWGDNVNDKKNDWGDAYNNKKSDWEDSKTNKKNDWGDSNNNKNIDWGDNENAKKNDWGDNYDDKKNDQEDNKSNKKNDWEDSKTKKKDDWEDSKTNKKNDWGEIIGGQTTKNKMMKYHVDKQRHKESYNNDRNTDQAWDRHANNDWDKVGVESGKKAVTFRTTKRFMYKPEPVRSYKAPSHSYKGHNDDVRIKKTGRSEKQVWNRHENNNWDVVGVDYNRKGRGSKKSLRQSDDRPSYVHTALPHRGR